jgi:hypothetical protein
MHERKTDRVYGQHVETILAQAERRHITKHSVSGMTTESAASLLNQLVREGRLRVVQPSGLGPHAVPTIYTSIKS